MSSQAAKRQHVLPQFIIRRFADADTRLVVTYDRKWSSTPKERRPRGIAYKRDYLTLDLPDPTQATMIEDKKLLVPDSRGAKLLDRIAGRRVVSSSDVPAAREFLALLHMRSPEYRWLAEAAVRHENDLLGRLAPMPDNQAMPDHSLGTADPSRYTGSDSGQLFGRNEVIRLQMIRKPALLKVLEQRTWNYLVVWLPYPGFVTSDNPIVAREAATGRIAPISSVGILNASEIWFLFDPHCALLLSTDWSLPPLMIDLPRHELRRVNTAVAAASDRWTIWQPGSAADQFLDLPATRRRGGD